MEPLTTSSVIATTPNDVSTAVRGMRWLINRSVISASLVLAFFLIAFGLQCKGRAFEAGFGSHSDEAGHYVTGLMVYKYVTTSLGYNPMAFAEHFYAHYPAVAFGHWPPLFYALQAFWGLFFGFSRMSVLVLIATLSALISLLLYNAGRESLGWRYGLLCATLFPLIPIVQQHTASIMGEVPLTLFTFATALSLARLIDRPTSTRAFWFGLWLCSAIYLKGNGWALVPLPVVVVFQTRSLCSLVKRHIWVPVFSVILCCAPVTWATLKMTKDGWAQQSFTVGFFCRALPTLLWFHLTIIGLPLLVCACIGIYLMVVRPFASGQRVQSLWASNAAVIITVLFFHAAVPTSMEERKLFMSIPSLLMFAAAGAKGVLEASHVRWLGFTFRKSAVYASAALLACLWMVRPYSLPHAEMGGIAARLLREKGLDHSAVLVATTEPDERAELSFVAEVADREHGNCSHAVVRAGKFIADSSWLGLDYKLRYSDVAQANEALRSIPISAIALYRGEGRSNAHGALIADLLRVEGDWQSIHSERQRGGEVELWASRTPREKEVRLPDIDLTRKLGRSISAEF